MPSSSRYSISDTTPVKASETTCSGSERELGEALEEVARLGVGLLMQTPIEAEVTEFLGRERYRHGERSRAGSRNGHCPTTVKTAGPGTIARPHQIWWTDTRQRPVATLRRASDHHPE
jgi:hypothetical protein